MTSRAGSGLLRKLTFSSGSVDFCSNDYLGFARSPALVKQIQDAEALTSIASGSTGSRLLSGNSALAEELEAFLAQFHQAEAALVFNSGYDANVGLLSCLPRRGDTLLTDELIHASMIDGARLSYATRHRFRHNDLNDLEARLKKATGTAYVAVESVYSMDGDMAPLTELAHLCDRYGAALLVDEAHATGVFGPNGEGLVVALGLQDRVFARIHTFGKALGVHGAAVVGPDVLRRYLINFARPFIYSTALPPHSLLAIRCAYEHLKAHPNPVAELHGQIELFRQKTQASPATAWWIPSRTPIQGLVVPGNEPCRAVAAALQAAGLDVRPILSPTVPAGQERLRICLHSFNTEAEMNKLFEEIHMVTARMSVPTTL